jgi:hypothetical protein
LVASFKVFDLLGGIRKKADGEHDRFSLDFVRRRLSYELSLLTMSLPFAVWPKSGVLARFPVR